MVDLVKQLREVQERDFAPDSLRTMVLWGADEIERLRAALKPFADLGYTGLPNQSHIDRAREVLGADEQ